MVIVLLDGMQEVHICIPEPGVCPQTNKERDSMTVEISTNKSKKVGTIPDGAQTAQPVDTGVSSSASGQQVKGLASALGMASSPSGLGLDAEEYIRALHMQCIDKEPKLKSMSIRTTNYEALVVHNTDTKKAIALLFGETYESFSDVPITYLLGDQNETGLLSQMKAHVPGFSLVHAVVVSPEDYIRTKQMASYLTNTLVQREKAEELGVEAFRAANLVVDTNIDRVRQFFDKTSPHSLPARCDIGFVLALQTPYTQNRHMAPEMQERPFLAVGGFVEVVRVPAAMASQGNPAYYGVTAQNEFVYKPVVRITELQTQIYSTFVLPLAIAIMADAFIGKFRWMTAFGFGEGKPNLGNVLIDQGKGKASTYFVTQQAEQSELLQKYYRLPPDLAIDVLEGRATHPAVNNLVRSEAFPAIANKISSLTGGAQIFQNVTKASWPISEGSVVWANKKTDSRQVDYFNMACNSKDASPFMPLLDKSTERVANVRNILGSMEVTYGGYECVLHPEFVNTVIAAMGNLNLNYKQPGPEIDVGTKNLVADGEINAFLRQQSYGGGGQGNPYSPFTSGGLI
jgi:hypothetical protein